MSTTLASEESHFEQLPLPPFGTAGTLEGSEYLNDALALSFPTEDHDLWSSLPSSRASFSHQQDIELCSDILTSLGPSAPASPSRLGVCSMTPLAPSNVTKRLMGYSLLSSDLGHQAAQPSSPKMPADIELDLDSPVIEAAAPLQSDAMQRQLHDGRRHFNQLDPCEGNPTPAKRAKSDAVYAQKLRSLQSIYRPRCPSWQTFLALNESDEATQDLECVMSMGSPISMKDEKQKYLARVLNRVMDSGDVPVLVLSSLKETVSANPKPFVTFLDGVHDLVMKYSRLCCKGAPPGSRKKANRAWRSWSPELKLFTIMSGNKLATYLDQATQVSLALRKRAAAVAKVLAGAQRRWFQTYQKAEERLTKFHTRIRAELDGVPDHQQAAMVKDLVKCGVLLQNEVSILNGF
eukprot:m.35419 g.35419  ORF g.35419 m.35419 type:complete len:406 (-) comp12392_c0_seq2:90-1307(-)